MSPKARTRAAAAALLALVAGGILAFGQATGTFAIFTAETESPNAAALGSWIPAPSLTSTALNNSSPYATEHLVWVSGNGTAMPGGAANPVTGQALLYADGGVGSNAAGVCPAAGSGSYSAFAPSPALTATSTTSDVTGNDLTHWWCWELQSTSAGANTSGSWTSDYKAYTSAQSRELFVVTGVSQNNTGGTVNKFENGDQLVLTFNQKRGPIGGGAGNGTVFVRACNTNIILISTAAIGSCAVTPNIGEITGQTVGTNRNCTTSTSAGNGTTTLTITLASCGGNSSIGAGTATFTPTGTGLAATSGTNLCSSAASPACTATTATRF